MSNIIAVDGIESDVYITIVEDPVPDVVVIIQEPTALLPPILVTIEDPSGPPGPPGASGEALSYLHNQVSPLDTWTINHNLGFKPLISIYDVGSVEVMAQVLHVNVNQTMVYFSSPTAGFARLI